MFGMTVIILWLDTNYVALKTFLDLLKLHFFDLQNGGDRTYVINKLIHVMPLE